MTPKIYGITKNVALKSEVFLGARSPKKPFSVKNVFLLCKNSAASEIFYKKGHFLIKMFKIFEKMVKNNSRNLWHNFSRSRSRNYQTHMSKGGGMKFFDA